jgi:hypothetical protein
LVKRLLFLSLPFIALILLKVFCVISTPELIYSLTGVTIFWYTIETYSIARDTKENRKRFEKPIVGLAVYPNESDSLDIRVRLVNLSNYQVAARICCVIKINEERVEDFYDAYAGKEYWNLQFKQTKEGHFSIVYLLLKKETITRE